MSAYSVIATVLAYFAAMFAISWVSSRNNDNSGFFNGGRKAPWWLVAIAMIGAPMSGVTFVSVPGMVGGGTGMGYMQMVLGFFVGYLVIAFVLTPVFFRMNMVSIYQYLDERFGMSSHKTGAWFWWGRDGAETYVRLWRYMYDYFRQEGLDNLIWVWTCQTSNTEDMDTPFYPGDEYVDIIGKDIYNISSPAAVKSIFDLVAGLYPNKMLTLSENGGIPSMAEQWDAGAAWLYFAPWYDYGNDHTENYAHQHADIAWWNASWACEDVAGLDELPDNLYK